MFFLRIELLWLGDPRFQRKQKFSATDLLDGTCIFTSDTWIIADQQMDGHTDKLLENTSPQTCDGV